MRYLLIFAILLTSLFNGASQTFPIRKGKLLTDLDAGGLSLTNGTFSGLFLGRELDQSQNLGSLSPFIDSYNFSNNLLKIVVIGDSYADSYRSISYNILRKLQSARGLAGNGLNSYGNLLLVTYTGGAYSTNSLAGTFANDGNWFSCYSRMPVSSTVTYHNGGNGASSEKVGLYWIAQPDGGDLLFQTSLNGAAFVTQKTVSGYAATQTPRYTNVSLALGDYRIKVVASSGVSNFVIGAETMRTTSKTNRLVPYFMDLGGQSADMVTNAPLALRIGVLTNIAPDLIIYHNIDSDNLDSWLTNAPYTDWLNSVSCPKLILGYHYIGDDGDTGYVPTFKRKQALVRASQATGWAFVDILPESISLTNQFKRGWMSGSDSIHLVFQGPGGPFLAQTVLGKIGLVPTPSVLSVEASAAPASTTSTNYYYFPVTTATTAAGARPTLVHLYTIDTSMYRQWGGEISTGAFAGGFLFQVNSTYFGDRTNIYYREHRFTTNIFNTTVLSGGGAAALMGSPKTIVGSNYEQGLTYGNPGVTNASFGSAWIKYNVNTTLPWFGPMTAGNGSIAPTNFSWLMGIEIKAEPN